MVYVKWVTGILMLLILVSIADYYLPERRVAQIIHTEVMRESFETEDRAGNPITQTRDIRQIYTLRPDGDSLVYNNVDAALYLKFDSADMYATAQKYISTESDPEWVMITSYGWRIYLLSWFPNVIGIEPVEEPVDPFPWLRIAIVVAFLLVGLFIYRMIQAAISRYVDPVIDSIDAEIDARSSAFTRTMRRMRRMVFGPSR